MPLSRINRPGIETRQGMHFAMMHDNMSIRVLVTRELLQSIAGFDASASACMQKFEYYRREFEAIASDKFDRGEKGALRIAPSDLLQLIAQKQGGSD